MDPNYKRDWHLKLHAQPHKIRLLDSGTPSKKKKKSIAVLCYKILHKILEISNIQFFQWILVVSGQIRNWSWASQRYRRRMKPTTFYKSIKRENENRRKIHPHTHIYLLQQLQEYIKENEEEEE